ncbi:MAG: peptide-methionine (S)-S-oxide reductase MsrA [Candidatus Omnitrophica bacterium]|nr:peptide-methionine (S)-S-oxide reductase MsrA [Candidatus Omnitrophota bacterium]
MSYRKATFAGGCFWGIEKVFLELDGVVSTQVGYTGGVTKNPVYNQVCSGRTGHAEAIEITYDPARVRYEDLLEVFFTHHDPTTLNRQGPDTGTQYRSAVFYHDLPQKEAVIKAKDVLDRAGVFKTKIVTEIQPVGEFYPAEEYHQKYLQKNPHGYCSIQLQSPRIKQALKESGPGETHE